MRKKEKGTLAGELVAKVATMKLRVEANSSSCGLIYQPKAPQELKKFKKK